MKRLIIAVLITFLSPASTVLAQDFCKGDFNYNGSVAAEDVETFLEHFGRNEFNNPCPPDGPAPVAKTGQTTSWATGDDGDLEKGLTWPNPRFNDRGNGTVVDMLTGLTWLKNANCFGQRTWNEALSDCSGLSSGSCGLADGSQAGDWGLPNLFELESLCDMQYYAPALSNRAGTGKWTEGNPFFNVQSNLYWSSTTDVSNTAHAWFVGMQHCTANFFSKDDWLYVWPVRGGHVTTTTTTACITDGSFCMFTNDCGTSEDCCCCDGPGTAACVDRALCLSLESWCW